MPGTHTRREGSKLHSLGHACGIGFGLGVDISFIVFVRPLPFQLFFKLRVLCFESRVLCRNLGSALGAAALAFGLAFGAAVLVPGGRPLRGGAIFVEAVVFASLARASARAAA